MEVSKIMMKQISFSIMPFLFNILSLLYIGQFLYQTIQSSFYAPSFLWTIFTFIICFLIFLGLREEFESTKKKINPHTKEYKLSSQVKTIAAIILNTMLTYFIATYFGVSTIFSASLVCFIFAFVFPSFESEAYSGCLAGMIGAYLCSHWSIALLTALMTGITFILFIPYFKNIGGRGGAIPYIATMVSVRLFLSLNPEQRQPINPELIIPCFLAILISALITYLLHYKNILTGVKAATLISLISAVILPVNLYTITTAIFAGTVVGMSKEDRIEGYGHLFIVAMISFILFIPSFHILDGIGGKIGLLSLLSYQASIGLRKIIISSSKIISSKQKSISNNTHKN